VDDKRFDILARSVGRAASRRKALRTVALATLGAAAAKVGLGTDATIAEEVTIENRYGCTNVGGACNGKDSQCCSSRCEGKGKGKKKKKKGKHNRRRDRRDKSQCVAHDEGGCSTGQDTCSGNGLQVPCGRGGRGACFITTGNASFCGQIQGGIPPAFNCFDCNQDQDCVNAGYGRDSACVICETNCRFTSNQTACVGPAD
jgi:hypothetical protein